MALKRRFVARNKKKTILRLCLLFAVPLLIAGIVFGCIKLLKTGGPRVKLSELPFLPEDSYTYTGSGFLYYKEGKLIYEDDSDKKKNYSLSATSASSSLRLAAGSGLSVLYNESSMLIAGANTPISFSGTVSRVLCGVSHIAVYVRSENSDSIEIYSADGTQTDVLDFSTASLINFGIDAGSEDTLWTLTLATNGGSPVSTVTTYNLTQGVTNGLMNVQDELIEDVFFTEKSIFLCGTNHIIRYNRSGNNEVYRELIYGYQPIDFSNSSSGPVFMLHSRAEDGFDNVRLYSLQEADLPSAKISNVQLPAGTLSARLYGGKLAVFTQSSLYLYDGGGVLSGSQELEEGISLTSVEKLSESKALISNGSALYALNMKG